MEANNNLQDLSHVRINTPSGGMVLLLNDGAIITAEDRAMLQALHSRNPKGVEEHLKTLASKGSGQLMASYYVGYNHKSIGDCGFGTLFIEGVSMLCAKAIQDSMLYNGQECSTRYIDFSSQPFFDSLDYKLQDNILTSKLRQFYLDNFDNLVEHLISQNPSQDDPNTPQYKTYLKAIKARAFDVMRGFLPAGATTNMAWTGNLRQFADHLVVLRNHPLLEVRETGEICRQVLNEGYTNSFGQKKYLKSEEYYHNFYNKSYYLEAAKIRNFLGYTSEDNYVAVVNEGIDEEALKEFFNDSIMNRPAKTELPKKVGICGTNSYYFELDFGSFRDIQRHRSVVQQMPLLETSCGFEEWYLDSLPDSIIQEAIELLQDCETIIDNLVNNGYLDRFNAQYLIPMGYKVPVWLSGDLPSLIYITEIRSSNTVHPTLQVKAQELGQIIASRYNIPIYCDGELNKFDTKRGSQDIVEK